ncbi:MAG TPA: hypothetical protein GX709_00445 [Clostridiales bacterium]|nr:hypothetical protein [Clostridiales bacterium]
MAKNNSKINEKSLKVRLVSNLELAEQNRNEPPKGTYPGGRFKRFFDTFKANFQTLMIANLCALLFILPIIALIMFFSMESVEKIGYMIAKIDEPYLMGSFGVGLSSGMTIGEAKSILLTSYRVFISSIALGLPLVGFGIAGILSVTTKLIWGESLLIKKDKQGRDVPRVATEFFRGLKKYWKGNVAIMSVTAVVFAGVANLFLNFVKASWLNNYNAGDIVSLVFGILITLAYFPFFINILPTTVTYNMPVKHKIKNALILTLSFYLPALLVFVFSALPFALLAVGRIMALIMMVLILSFGMSFVCLMIVNYNDYNHEKIIEPLYLAKMKDQMKRERRARRKKK